jgi:hypothetical protein
VAGAGACAGQLTTFHLLDPGGRPVGQQDREPANASYRTGRWQQGDVVIDRFTPRLADDARGPVTIRVGLYNQVTGERLTMGEMDEITLKPVEWHGEPRSAPLAAPPKWGRITAVAAWAGRLGRSSQVRRPQVLAQEGELS